MDRFLSPAGVVNEKKQAKKTAAFLGGSVLFTLLLYYVPYGRIIAYPLVLLSTLVHELGHGVASMLCGYEFIEFQMFSDGSGFAATEGRKGRFASAFVAAGGLLGPALVAALFFRLGRDEKKARLALYGFSGMLLLALVFVVRNAFGVLFVTATAALCLTIARAGRQRPWLAHAFLLFLACQLALAVFSRADYLFTATAHTADGAHPSDVQKMADALFLPYWFWGAFCGLLSVAVVFRGLRSSLKRL
ncbi:MAG: M50 family metallopeptidase [Myxococcota bacterium]|nr:M50 family metallopeptidase [Myxococcota bacterium]